MRNPDNKLKPANREVVLKQSRANLQTVFIIPQPGRLLLTGHQLIFIPNRLSFSLQEPQSITLNLTDIATLEKIKGDTANLLAGSYRSRLRIQCNGKTYILQVWGIEEWIQRIKEAMSAAL